MGDRAVARLMANAGIVRNRLKIEAAIGNARAFLAVQDAHGSFAAYIWGFINQRPIQNSWTSLAELPASTPLAEAVSRDSRSAASGSSGRRSSTPTCRPPAWSTTIS